MRILRFNNKVHKSHVLNEITLFNYSLYLNMGTSEITTEINKLPEAEKNKRLTIAAEKLYDDYLNDPELTVFTILDNEDFYEAK